MNVMGLSGKGSGDWDTPVTYHLVCIAVKSYLKTGQFKALNHVIECNLSNVCTLQSFVRLPPYLECRSILFPDRSYRHTVKVP